MFVSAFRKTFTKKINQIPVMAFGGGSGPVKGRLMVKDKIIWLYVEDTYGEIRKVPGFEGQTVFEAIQNSKVEGFGDAHCNGGDTESPPSTRPFDYTSWGPMCNQCQIVLPEEWSSKIKMYDGERNFIEKSDNYTHQNSRLACCLPLKKWMDGMPIKMGLNELSTTY